MRMHPCEAVARRRWAKIARIGYAIRQARRDRAPRLPICSDEKMATVGASDSVTIKSERSAEDLGGDASGLSSTMMPSSPVEAPAAPRRAEIPRGGGTMPPGRRQLEEWARLAAPGLFDQLTHDGNRSAVAAVRWRGWRPTKGGARRCVWRVVWTRTLRSATAALSLGLSWSAVSSPTRSPTSRRSSTVCFAVPETLEISISPRCPFVGRGGGGGALVLLGIGDATVSEKCTCQAAGLRCAEGSARWFLTPSQDVGVAVYSGSSAFSP